jgi:hypothetical protein
VVACRAFLGSNRGLPRHLPYVCIFLMLRCSRISAGSPGPRYPEARHTTWMETRRKISELQLGRFVHDIAFVMD